MNLKAQSTVKVLTLGICAIIAVLALIFVVRAITITPDPSNPSGVTNQSTINASYNITLAINNITFDTAGSGNNNPWEITMNDTNILIMQNVNELVYRYWSNGTYINTFSISAQGNFQTGLSQNDTFFWTVDQDDDRVYRYWLNGTYTGVSFDLAGSGNTNGQGITNNGTYFWITDNTADKIFTYWMNGTYVSNFSFNQGSNEVRAIATDNTYLYTVDFLDAEVYRYWINGTYTGFHFDTAGAGALNYGIEYYGGYLWITSSNSDKVTKYNLDGTIATSIEPLQNITWSWNGTNYTFYDDSLVLFYNFDNRSALGENSTLIKGSSIYNQSFLFSLNQQFDTGKYGLALKSNGSSGTSTLVNSAFNNTNSYTNCLWVNILPETGDDYQTIGGIYNSGNNANKVYLLNFRTTSLLEWEIWNNSGNSVLAYGNVGNVTNQGWIHACIVMNSTHQSTYRNGVLVDTDTNIVGLNISNVTGQFNLAGDFNGSIDDLMFWNRSLSTSEIEQVYKTGITKFNESQYNFYANESTSVFGTNYFLCASNSTSESCSSTNNVQLTSAITLTPISTPSGTTTNRSTLIEYNFSTNYFSNLSLSWGGTNYTFWDKRYWVWGTNFNNLSDLGESDIRVFDISGNGKNGTVLNSLNWCATCGKNDGGFNFTGTNYSAGAPRYISMSNPITNATQNFTFSVWVKPYFRQTVAPHDKHHIINLYGQYDGWIGFDDNYFTVNQRDNVTGDLPITSSSQYEEGAWYFVTYTRQDTPTYHEFKLYVNGLYQGGKNISIGNAIITTASSTFIGGHTGYPQYDYLSFNGSIDDMNLWNRTFSGSEITQLYGMQLKQYNLSDWNLLYNKSLPSTNQTNSYYLCVSNFTGSVCSNSNSLTSGWSSIIYANFTNKLGDVHPLFYGVGLQSPNKLVDRYLDLNCDGTSEYPSNITWQRQTLLDSGAKITYYDGRIASYYSGFANNGFEYWYLNVTNITVSSNVSYYNLTLGTSESAGSYGTSFGSYRDAVSIVNKTTDAHSGTYAVQMNTSIAGQSVAVGTFFTTIYLEAGHTYTGSIWVKGSGDSVGWYNSGNSGYSNFSSYSTTSTWIQKNVTITPNSTTAGNWRFGVDINQGNNITFDDLYFFKDGEPYYWWYIPDSLNTFINATDWEYANGIKSMIILDYMPYFLADKNEKCVGVATSIYVQDCSSINNEILAEINLDQYKRITREDPGKMNNTYVQIWNEPYGGFFQDQLPWGSAKTDFIYLFGNISSKFIDYYPDIQIWGYRDSDYNGYTITNFTDMMFDNFPEIMTNYDFHPYSSNPYFYSQRVSDRMSYLISEANSRGANVQHISASEWQPTSQAMKNISNAQSPQYYSEIAFVYSDVLNSYANMSTLIPYHWDDSVSYFNCFSRYPENTGNAPWMSVSEKGLDNTTDPVYYPPYIIPKLYSEICSAGTGDVYETTFEEGWQVTSCQDGDKYSLVLINTENQDKNTVIDMNGLATSLTNLETGTVYTVGDTISLGGYERLFLQSDEANPIITINEPDSNETGNSLVLDITTNEVTTCTYVLDTANNVSMTTSNGLSHQSLSISLGNGPHTVKFYCTDSFGNRGYNSINFEMLSGTTQTQTNGYTQGATTQNQSSGVNGTTNDTVAGDIIPGEEDSSKPLGGLSWVIIVLVLLIIALIVYAILK